MDKNALENENFNRHVLGIVGEKGITILKEKPKANPELNPHVALNQVKQECAPVKFL
jgi:hypothetical protein